MTFLGVHDDAAENEKDRRRENHPGDGGGRGARGNEPDVQGRQADGGGAEGERGRLADGQPSGGGNARKVKDFSCSQMRGGVSKKCKGFNGGRAENGLVC